MNHCISQHVVLYSDITESVEGSSVHLCLILVSKFSYRCKVLYSFSLLILCRMQLNMWQCT